jgi:hypothetical protein
MAEHPFVLEFPIKASDHWQITNFRRRREHHILTLLLNVLLVGRTSFAPSRSRHLWATAPDKEFSPGGAKWAQEFYFADIGEIVRDELAPPAAELLEEVDPDTYYTKVGHDGRGLRVPADLDDSICHYLELSKADKQKFGRAAFWMDMASHQWTLSLSASFASLCIACEALGERTAASTRRFKDFIERYAPSASLQVRREQMWGALDFGAVTPGRISR